MSTPSPFQSTGFPSADHRQGLGDRATLLAAALAPLFFIVGTAAAGAGGGALTLPPLAARALVVLSLGASTFYTLLDVDVSMSFQKAALGPVLMVALQASVRAAAGAALLARAAALRAALGPEEACAVEYAFAYATLGALLWLVPPALTAPATSLMWGGGLYLAVACSITLTAALPLLILAAGMAGATPGVAPAALGFFFAVAAAGCAAPAAAAAAARSRWPVAAKKHSKSWKWLAAPALWAMAFVGGNMAAPPHMADGCVRPHVVCLRCARQRMPCGSGQRGTHDQRQS
jgi:hypothetical protein